MHPTDPARRFTGWLLLAGAALSFAVSSGLMHAFTVFFVAFLAEFGWTRADASIAYALSQLMIGVSAPLVGGAVDRFGPRRLVAVGGSLLALSLAASAVVSSLWHLIIIYGLLMTLGANCLGLVVFTPMIARWFAHRLGFAIAVIQAANGMGRAVATPLSQILVETIGWRQSYLLMAAFMALVLLPLLGLLRQSRTEPDTQVADRRSPAAPITSATPR
ncbi:MAG: MFS transporter, partial [Candidatus Tectomicrobia bacterium]|nr:MFS transporter [Candidatus Tectomicrobia bacterium]